MMQRDGYLQLGIGKWHWLVTKLIFAYYWHKVKVVIFALVIFNSINTATLVKLNTLRLCNLTHIYKLTIIFPGHYGLHIVIN